MGHIAILMWPVKASSSSRLKRVIKKTVFPLLARHGMDRLVIPAPRQRKLVIERWRIPAERVVAAKWTVDTRFWHPVQGTGETICSVGREMRDYGTLIEALRLLEVPCHIATGASVLNPVSRSDDPRASNVSAQALPAGVTSGHKSAVELRELYGRSRLVVVPLMPTETDNGTTAILEAMAMGRAVIITATGGRTEILEDEVNCVLVPPRDPGALRAVIEELWKDPDRCAQLGAEGRKRVVAEHSIDQWLTAIRDAAADVASARRLANHDDRLTKV
jgi:glycosyltransferase involved in cell wall biosynthesis